MKYGARGIILLVLGLGIRGECEGNVEDLMRKIVFALLVGLLCAWPAFAGGETASGETIGGQAQKFPIVMVTDVAGLGDEGSNDAAWAGVKRAAAEFALPSDVIQSREQADYVANLSTAAERAKVVVSVGSALADALKSVAPRRGDTYFIQIEGRVSGLPNVLSFDFKSQEGGFLAGVVAAAYTKTGKVGAVSGIQAPLVDAYAVGFLAGVKAVAAAKGAEIEATVLSAGSFDDSPKGKSLSEKLILRGSDVIFSTAGGTGAGVWEAVKARENVKIIWKDADRDASAPGKVLASVLKRVDNAVFQGVQMAVDVRWQGGHKVLGYREGGIALSAMTGSSALFSEAELAMISEAKRLLGRGEVAVPDKESQLEDWEPPDLAKSR